jgi:hypothetical protein
MNEELPYSVAASCSTTASDDDDTEAPAVDADNPSTPSLDVVFDVLRNSRRRLVITRLAEIDGPTTRGDLAEHIGGIENDKEPSLLSSKERKRVYVGLYQSHLPKMADAGAIQYDDRGTVDRGQHFHVFREYLGRAPPER